MKQKTITITVTGNQYPFGIKIPRIEIYTYNTTGSNLDIRRKESMAITDFMRKYNIGSCGAKSVIS